MFIQSLAADILDPLFLTYFFHRICTNYSMNCKFVFYILLDIVIDSNVQYSEKEKSSANEQMIEKNPEKIEQQFKK